MSYKITWDNKAYNSLQKLDLFLSRRIVKLIREFSDNPYAKDVRKLKGEKAFRLRAGDYRIILDIDHENQVIKILRIGHRKNIYEQ